MRPPTKARTTREAAMATLTSPSDRNEPVVDGRRGDEALTSLWSLLLSSINREMRPRILWASSVEKCQVT
jgi:hypothetical protein